MRNSSLRWPAWTWYRNVKMLVRHLVQPRSLFWHLLVMFLLVMIVAVVTMGMSASWLSQHAINDYREQNALQKGNAQKLANTLHTAYSHHQKPADIQALVEYLAQSSHVQILLVDQQRQVIADSLRSWLGRSVLPAEQQPAGHSPSGTGSSSDLSCPELIARSVDPLLLAYIGTQPPCPAPFTILGLAGNALIFPIGVAVTSAVPRDHVVLASVNDILLLAMLIGGLAALLLAVLFSFLILSPLKILTRVAYRMEQGDHSQRVTIKIGGELTTLGYAFNTMAESLQRSEQLRRNMVSDIAHELRTPLTTIQAYLDAIEDQVIEPTPATIASLQEESLLLGRLVTDLQELSLAEAGQLSLHRQPLALKQCITVAVQSVQASARKKQISVSLALAEELPCVDADVDRVGQILRNLLKNAIIHTPSGGTITVQACEIRHEVQICVQDTGEGIAAHHLPHLFERFYRADASRSRKTGGMGLGLVIVKRLVQMHGGHVGVQSTPGHGSQFFFTLPIVTAMLHECQQENVSSFNHG